MSEHQHDWAEPQRNHVGWQTSCKSCTAWWSDPHAPSGPPDWMTTTCSMTTVPEGVVYPADVPSDTIDSPPRLAGEGRKRPGQVVSCCDCGREVELPPVPERDGWVSITPLDGWSAPPVRCPACTEAP